MRRYFAIINESGNILLTWGKKDDAVNMSKAEQRFRVDEITATWTGQEDENGQILPSFVLNLPADIGVYAKAEKRGAKLAAKSEKRGAKEVTKAAKAKAAKAKRKTKEEAKAAAAYSPMKKNGSLGDGLESEPEPEPEPEPDDEPDDEPTEEGDEPEEGEPPEGGDGDADGDGDAVGEGEGQQVEICMHKADEGGFGFCRFMEALYAAGAKLEGGAAEDVESMHGLTILQDGERGQGVEFKLDDNNTIIDFKGSMLSSKGITLGLKLGKINHTLVLGW